MPSKYVLRSFEENRYYHIYNHGVERRDIFLDESDYQTFLHYISIYTLSTSEIKKRYPDLPARLYSKNLSKGLSLISYVLMPDHFHLLLYQEQKDAIPKLLKQVSNAYTLYFNKKYNRVGALFQGRYKAVSITSENQLIHLNRYIHLNPLISGLINNLTEYPWSSYSEFSTNSNGLCKKDGIFARFMSLNNYNEFMKDEKDYKEKLDKIKHLIIEKI